jgi:hypothetical protein
MLRASGTTVGSQTRISVDRAVDRLSLAFHAGKEAVLRPSSAGRTIQFRDRTEINLLWGTPHDAKCDIVTRIFQQKKRVQLKAVAEATLAL